MSSTVPANRTSEPHSQAKVCLRSLSILVILSSRPQGHLSNKTDVILFRPPRAVSTIQQDRCQIHLTTCSSTPSPNSFTTTPTPAVPGLLEVHARLRPPGGAARGAGGETGSLAISRDDVGMEHSSGDDEHRRAEAILQANSTCGRDPPPSRSFRALLL